MDVFVRVYSYNTGLIFIDPANFSLNFIIEEVPVSHYRISEFSSFPNPKLFNKVLYLNFIYIST